MQRLNEKNTWQRYEYLSNYHLLLKAPPNSFNLQVTSFILEIISDIVSLSHFMLKNFCCKTCKLISDSFSYNDSNFAYIMLALSQAKIWIIGPSLILIEQ